MARFNNPLLQAIDINGDVDIGATLRFEEPGTTTLKTIYSDSDLSVPTTNPQTPDSAGRFVGDIFLDGLYRVRFIDGNSSTVFDFDPVGDTASGQFEIWDTTKSYDIPEIVLGSDDEYYRSLQDSNQGNDPTTSPSQWEQLELGRIYNVNVTYSIGDTAIDSSGFYYASVTNGNLNNNPVTDVSNTNWRPAINPANLDAATLNLSNFRATQAEQETGTETDAFVAPATQQFHQSAAKKWVQFDGSGTPAINQSYNVTSITDNGTGDFDVNFTGSFSAADYCFSGGARIANSSPYVMGSETAAPAVGALPINVRNAGGTFTDATIICVLTLGDI